MRIEICEWWNNFRHKCPCSKVSEPYDASRIPQTTPNSCVSFSVCPWTPCRPDKWNKYSSVFYRSQASAVQKSLVHVVCSFWAAFDIVDPFSGAVKSDLLFTRTKCFQLEVLPSILWHRSMSPIVPNLFVARLVFWPIWCMRHWDGTSPFCVGVRRTSLPGPIVPWVSLPGPTGVPSDAQAGWHQEQSANPLWLCFAAVVGMCGAHRAYTRYSGTTTINFPMITNTASQQHINCNGWRPVRLSWKIIVCAPHLVQGWSGSSDTLTVRRKMECFPISSMRTSMTLRLQAWISAASMFSSSSASTPTMPPFHNASVLYKQQISLEDSWKNFLTRRLVFRSNWMMFNHYLHVSKTSIACHKKTAHHLPSKQDYKGNAKVPYLITALSAIHSNNCQCEWLFAWPLARQKLAISVPARENSETSLLFPEKFLFCTGMIPTIE